MRRRPPTAATALLPLLLLVVPVSCQEVAPPPGQDGAPPAPSPQEPPDDGAAAPAAAQQPQPRPQPPRGDLEARRLRYLELAWDDLHRLERAIGELGSQRDAIAALTTAALAAHGRGEPAPARGHAAKVLDVCAGAWHKGDCERAALDLQRALLQYPGVFDPPLRQRLRSELSQMPAPPPQGEIDDPWSFAQTENQRAVTTARALGAAAVAGEPAPDRWRGFAAAFLRSRDRRGWYEEDSPGYLGITIEALLHLYDFAPQPVRGLAGRQLNLLLADWAEQQVGGVPAGARSRTYAHWALGTRNTPWRAWAWFYAGMGDPSDVELGDWPDVAVTEYRIPDAVADLLAGRRGEGSYEIRERRRFDTAKRRSVDAALYSWATPDYVLSAAQAVGGMELAVSGGQEIHALLLPEGGTFAPLYLWSRVDASHAQRWRSRAAQEKAVAHENRLLARLGGGGEPGYAYFAPPWGAPEQVGNAVVARYGDTYVALLTDGGWELAPAPQRFPDYFGRDKAYGGSRVAVPRRQPAAVALVAGRAGEVGSFAVWKERVQEFALEVRRRDGEPVRLTLTTPGAPPFTFHPGESASVGERGITARDYPVHASPFLSHEAARGTWRFRHGEVDYRFKPLR